MKARKLNDFFGEGVVIGCGHDYSCQHPYHRNSYESFYTVDKNPKANPDFVFDLTSDLPEEFNNRFTLTLLEGLAYMAYSNAPDSPFYIKGVDPSIGLRNALKMTKEDGFILILGCPRVQYFRFSLASLD